MKGKVCVVTGASSGIGLEVTRGLAAQGARVVMVCRSRERGEAAMAEVRRSAPGAELELVLADLYLMSEVRRAAAEIRERCPALHVLVNNAGLIHGKHELTAEGLERTFALNHMAYFVMTHELRELLGRSAPARVVCLASGAHGYARLDLGDLQWARRPYKEIQAYGDSKLMNILFARVASRRMPAGVTVNSMHPGAVGTNFGASGSRFMRAVMAMGRPFILSSAKGADTAVWLASAAEAAAETGKYFYKRRARGGTAAARDDGMAEKVWALSEQTAGVRWG